MHSETYVPSELADVLLGQLAFRAADHRILFSLDTTTQSAAGRHLRSDSQSRHGNALIDFVAIAEAFSVGRLLPLLVSPKDEVGNSWHSRTKAWSRASVDLSQFADWGALMGFVDVRNALQHGLGRLTDLQLGKRRHEHLAQIRACGVHLNGDLLTVTALDAERCYRICAHFIQFLDRSCSMPRTGHQAGCSAT